MNRIVKKVNRPDVWNHSSSGTTNYGSRVRLQSARCTRQEEHSTLCPGCQQTLDDITSKLMSIKIDNLEINYLQKRAAQRHLADEA